MVLNAMNSFEMPKFTLVVVVCGEAPVQMEHWRMTIFLTRARPGGGGYQPPLRFFADGEKTAARSAVKFAIAVQPTIWHI